MAKINYFTILVMVYTTVFPSKSTGESQIT